MANYKAEQLAQLLKAHLAEARERFSDEVALHIRAGNKPTLDAMPQFAYAIYDALDLYQLPTSTLMWGPRFAGDSEVIEWLDVKVMENDEVKLIASLNADDLYALTARHFKIQTEEDEARRDADLDITVGILDATFYWGKDVAKGSPVIELRAALTEPYRIRAAETQRIPVGLVCHHSNPAYIGMVIPNAELAREKNLTVAGSPQVIVAGNKDPLFVTLLNQNDHGDVTVNVNPGDIIGQLIYLPIARPAVTIGNVAKDDEITLPVYRYHESKEVAETVITQINRAIQNLPEVYSLTSSLTRDNVEAVIAWISRHIKLTSPLVVMPAMDIEIEGRRDCPNININIEDWGRTLAFSSTEVYRIAMSLKNPVKETPVVEGVVDDLSEHQAVVLRILENWRPAGPQVEPFFQPATEVDLIRGGIAETDVMLTNGRVFVKITNELLAGTNVRYISNHDGDWSVPYKDYSLFSECLQKVLVVLGVKGALQLNFDQSKELPEYDQVRISGILKVNCGRGVGMGFDKKRFDWFLQVFKRFEEEEGNGNS